ncbi:hypothetical protein CUC45_06825 [Citrobacter freundii]|nr:hypothetical protein CUC45_06825 [Citrobacter freundii]
MFAGKKSAQIREILISESAWEEMTCLFAPSLEFILRILNVFNIRLSHLVSEVFYEDTQVFSKARSIIQNNSMTKTIN